MLVFNLTAQELKYKGRFIPPNGGSTNYPELDKGFIPNRDRELEKKRVLAFGSLPYWWTLQEKVKSAALTRKQVEARDEKRVEEAKARIEKGEEPIKVVVETISSKVIDEMRVESQARTILPAVPVVQKDKNFGGKNRR